MRLPGIRTVGRGAVRLGDRLFRYRRRTLESGETVVNFWLGQ